MIFLHGGTLNCNINSITFSTDVAWPATYFHYFIFKEQEFSICFVLLARRLEINWFQGFFIKRGKIHVRSSGPFGLSLANIQPLFKKKSIRNHQPADHSKCDLSSSKLWIYGLDFHKINLMGKIVIIAQLLVENKIQRIWFAGLKGLRNKSNEIGRRLFIFSVSSVIPWSTCSQWFFLL